MGKWTNDALLDLPLDDIETNCTLLIVCNGQPTGYSGGSIVGATELGRITIDGTDFTKADGDVSGRKSTVGAQTGISVTATGSADHIALVDGTGEVLKHVTTCNAQSVSSGGTMDTSAFDVEFEDPA